MLFVKKGNYHGNVPAQVNIYIYILYRKYMKSIMGKCHGCDICQHYIINSVSHVSN